MTTNPQQPDEDFDHFADDWWDPKGRLASLHKINAIRVEYFVEITDKLSGGLEGKRVLDLGCGGGILSESLAKAGAKVTGIDLSFMAIETAKKHAPITGPPCIEIDYRLIAASDLKKEKPKKFDMIFCSEVLEHVDDLDGLVRDGCALLKKGGIFFFSTINKTLMAKFLAVFVAEDILGMLPQGTHDSSRFIRPSELVRIFRENNVDVEEIKGMSFDPLKFKFRITRDTSVNYLGYGVKV
ncbi:MAG: bifunctional 2-polyprenyl-6-hydroxyphenol methylase/3-demethylubiquinol 3-O-methyltransferase UbiG [Thermodesulfobacteriota bacterium]